MTNNDKTGTKPYASSPCYAHELDKNDHPHIDPADKTAVARWQIEERRRLLGARSQIHKALPQLALEIADEITRLIDLRPGLIVSLYWPIRGEIDFRDWMHALAKQRVRVVLPVVTQKAYPMVFREWTPTARMQAGMFDIPVPAEGQVLIPDIVIAPLLGFDAGCYRLGYGGGYYDRTLASLSAKPTVIGVGHPLCEIPTIYPQPHDIPMDIIVTGAARVKYRDKAE